MGKKKNAGFTLLEVIIVIAILSFLAIIVAFDFISFKKGSDLDNNAQEFVSVSRTAQNKTISSENYSQYGVYLNVLVQPNQYTLFKGSSYALREISFDRVYSLQNTIEFFDISLINGEIVFDRLTGASREQGSVSIRIKADPDRIKTVYISSSGAVGFNQSGAPSDTNRVKDSRYLQFSYSRVIDTANENMTLTFDNSETQIIPISLYLVAGELQWKGTVDVGGVNQTVEINTHRLNNPDTLFSIRRDRRYNDKSLKVTISGDSSGYLTQYSADGLTTDFSSIYVSGFEWQ